MSDAGVMIKVDVSALMAKLEAANKTLSVTGLLKAIGLRQLKWVDDNFRTSGGLVGGWKPLSPFTVAMRRNRSSKPLQDSGALRASFNPVSDPRAMLVQGNTVKIGSAIPYASYHEFGTGPIVAKGRALAIPGAGGKMMFLKSTAGIPKRRMLPTEQEGLAVALSVIKARVERLNDAST